MFLPTFLNATLLWGMGLASIPVIIHLLYRRRFRRIEWAPMHYLKISLKRNRRRIRIEQILLLLLRVAAVLLLFYTVARPVMHASGLASWLTGRSRTNQVIVIDDSLSMGYQDIETSAFSHAKRLAAEIVTAAGDEDRITLLVASRPEMPLFAEVETTERDEILQAIEQLRPTDIHVTWSKTLDVVRHLIDASTYKKTTDLTIITDLRRAGWDQRVSEIGDALAAEKVRMRVFDVGSPATDNLAITSLERLDRVAVVGTTIRWQATVRNDTTEEVAAADATFSVDGKPAVVRLPAIAAASSATLSFSARFQKPGLHNVSLTLPEDNLAGDNQRWNVIEVRQQIDVLLVDGEPTSEAADSETYFLAPALSISEQETAGWRIEQVTDAEWESLPLRNPDLIVLANVATISERRAAKLSKLVRSGTGLMIFLGDQVDPDVYNQHLFRQGNGLLPVELLDVSDDQVKGILIEDNPPSPLDMLRSFKTAAARVNLRRLAMVRLIEPPPEGVRVLARWNNAQAAPAAIEKTVGRGHVILWTTTADTAWSDWPSQPLYVMAVRQSAQAIVRGDTHIREITVGNTLVRRLIAVNQVSSATIEKPLEPKPLPLRTVFSQRPSGRSQPSSLTFDLADRAGIYRLAWQQTPDGAKTERIAVNPDPRESNLLRIEGNQLKTMFGNLAPDVIALGNHAEANGSVRGEELWRSLAVGLFALLIGEAGLATWVGRAH